METRENPYDPATAYHEAGHAVAALAHDRPVRFVSVLPRRDYLGLCGFGKGVFRPTKDWLEQEILIALAGMAAEARHRGEYARAGADRDLRYVRRLAVQRAGERQAERLERRLLAKVENMLADETVWKVVEFIVVELLQRGEISGRTAKHLFEQCRRTDL
jgi:ATP-dependent Zn protease